MKQLDYRKINHYIQQIAAGNRRAADKLFEYTYINMLEIAQFYLFDKKHVEDVMVELYKIIITKACTFNAKKNGYNWMYTITKNLAFRQNKETQKFEYIGSCDIAVENADFEPLEKLLVAEIMEILNERDKKLLIQIFWEGYTIKEIAAMQNAPTATIYTQRARIYKKIKKHFKK